MTGHRVKSMCLYETSANADPHEDSTAPAADRALSIPGPIRTVITLLLLLMITPLSTAVCSPAEQPPHLRDVQINGVSLDSTPEQVERTLGPPLQGPGGAVKRYQNNATENITILYYKLPERDDLRIFGINYGSSMNFKGMSPIHTGDSCTRLDNILLSPDVHHQVDRSQDGTPIRYTFMDGDAHLIARIENGRIKYFTLYRLNSGAPTHL